MEAGLRRLLDDPEQFDAASGELPRGAAEASGSISPTATRSTGHRRGRMSAVFDTKVLVHAPDEDSRPPSSRGAVCYEFPRVTTHDRAPVASWTLPEARAYIESLLTSPGFQGAGGDPASYNLSCTDLVGTARSGRQPDARPAHGRLVPERGIHQICALEASFHREPFVTVSDPSCAS